jgi:hypothetical protein
MLANTIRTTAINLDPILRAGHMLHPNGDASRNDTCALSGTRSPRVIALERMFVSRYDSASGQHGVTLAAMDD